MIMKIEDFKSFNLTKKARIVLEEGKYIGDTIDDLGVYSLYDFWVIVDEKFLGATPSYVNVVSAEAVTEKPYIPDPFDENDETRLARPD